MKKTFLLLLIAIFTLNPIVKADEGMWILSLIGKNYEEMKKQGFKLTPEDIYNVNNKSLKDAVIGLGKEGNPFWHFCTAELISGEGLMSTNHHCGFGMIQSHSSVEHDYLRDGFWAYNKSEELPNEGITAQILVRIEDVSDKILPKLHEELTYSERMKIIKSIGEELSKKAVKDTNHDAQVVDIFNGNQFLLFEYITYKDIRLVGAPPQAMGKFGGDTDNWEWPRHTADFSLFRIYTDSEGNPAEYSEKNVPLKPKHFFPISIRGFESNDFAMVMGFPGTTDRFLTSYGLDETMNIVNDLVYKIRSVKINILREKMAMSQKTRIQYASKYASCSNYWKYSLQQNKALKKLDTKSKKIDVEKKYNYWAKKQDSKYQNALKNLESAYNKRKDSRRAQVYLSEGLLSGPDLFYFAFKTSRTLQYMNDMKDGEDKAALKESIMKDIDLFYKDFDVEVERLLISEMVDYTYNNMDKKYYPDFLEKGYKNGKKFADKIIKKSIYSSKEKLINAIEKNNVKAINNDPAFDIAQSTITKLQEINKNNKETNEIIEQNKRLFVYGLLQINKNEPVSPDANSTIRATYGRISGYEPRDGVMYNYYTTLKGVIEKEDPTSTEFIVPEKLKELYYAQDFGEYANINGELPVCFISNNDITGGNSGSPVLDAEGNLIGLAFDGNSEAMSGDIDFESNLQRCINLDVRYMLFIIDKFAGASNLIKELKIVR